MATAIHTALMQRQEIKATAQANNVLTVFTLSQTDVNGNPVVLNLARTTGKAGTGGGLNSSFTLVPALPATAGNVFTLTGTPGAYVATFSSAPTEANGVLTDLYFDLTSPILPS